MAQALYFVLKDCLMSQPKMTLVEIKARLARMIVDLAENRQAHLSELKNCTRGLMTTSL